MNNLQLAEYNSLRAEILQSQQTRIVILGFVLVAFGTVAGFALGENAPRDIEFVAGLTGLEFLLIVSALYITIVLTHRIELIAAFLRTRREEGEMWEGWLKRARETDPGERSRFRSVVAASPPLNTSRSLAVVYIFLIVGAVLVYLGGVRGTHTLFATLVPIVGTIVSILAVSQLWRRSWDLDRYLDRNPPSRDSIPAA